MCRGSRWRSRLLRRFRSLRHFRIRVRERSRRISRRPRRFLILGMPLRLLLVVRLRRMPLRRRSFHIPGTLRLRAHRMRLLRVRRRRRRIRILGMRGSRCLGMRVRLRRVRLGVVRLEVGRRGLVRRIRRRRRSIRIRGRVRSRIRRLPRRVPARLPAPRVIRLPVLLQEQRTGGVRTRGRIRMRSRSWRIRGVTGTIPIRLR